MYHASHIIVCVLIGMSMLERSMTAKPPPINELLSMIASHVGSILTPSLADEIERRIINRTSTTIPPPTAQKSILKSQSSKFITPISLLTKKKPEINATSTTIRPTTFHPTTINKLEAAGELSETFLDSARAPQTQFENQFPFDFRNNFQNYPGVGISQGTGRQFNGGLFGGRDSFNPDVYRPFNSPLDGERGGENGVQGIDPRFSGREAFFNGPNRSFNSPDSPQEFERYQQSFPPTGFNGRYPGSNRFFDQGFRGDAGADRFSNFVGQPTDDRNNLLLNSYRQDLRTNYQNPVGSEQRQGLPAFLGSSNPQQAYAHNSFDILPSQRFPNPYSEGTERNSQQRGPNFPQYFPSRIADGSLQVDTSGSSLLNSNREKDDAVSPGSLQSATRRTEGLEKVIEIDAKEPVLQRLNPQITQTREELENLFLPRSDDYSDIRTRPDAFKPPLIASNFVAKDPKINVQP